MTRPHQDWITPNRLDPKTKHELWTGLKALDPNLATLLQTDPTLSQLKQAFSATVRFTRQNAERYVKEGRKILEEKHHANPQRP